MSILRAIRLGFVGGVIAVVCVHVATADVTDLRGAGTSSGADAVFACDEPFVAREVGQRQGQLIVTHSPGSLALAAAMAWFRRRRR